MEKIIRKINNLEFDSSLVQAASPSLVYSQSVKKVKEQLS